jgi:hypothetical protein
MVDDSTSTAGRMRCKGAVGSLLAAFNFSLRALGVLVPLAVAGGLAWLAFAAVRRRRREAVLG